MPGTARTPVRLSHHEDVSDKQRLPLVRATERSVLFSAVVMRDRTQSESHRKVYKEEGSGWKPEPHRSNSIKQLQPPLIPQILECSVSDKVCQR